MVAMVILKDNGERFSVSSGRVHRHYLYTCLNVYKYLRIFDARSFEAAYPLHSFASFPFSFSDGPSTLLGLNEYW